MACEILVVKLKQRRRVEATRSRKLDSTGDSCSGHDSDGFLAHLPFIVWYAPPYSGLRSSAAEFIVLRQPPCNCLLEPADFGAPHTHPPADPEPLVATQATS